LSVFDSAGRGEPLPYGWGGMPCAERMHFPDLPNKKRDRRRRHFVRKCLLLAFANETNG